MAADSVLTLRGHHLLCVLGFRGLGYSEEFVRNLRQVVDRVLGEPDTALQLVDECDAVCEPCPHRRGRRCFQSAPSGRRPSVGDRRVLARLGLEPGARLTAGEALRLVAARVAPEDIGRALCVKCQWRGLGYCAAGLAELRRSQTATTQRHDARHGKRTQINTDKHG